MEKQEQSRLTRFNNQWGFPIQKHNNSRRKRHVIEKFVCSIPFFPVVAHFIRYGIKSTKQKWHQESKKTRKRIILCSSILGIPVVLLLDIFATLVTQPIGLYRDHRDQKKKENPTPNSIKASYANDENDTTTNSDMDEKNESDTNSDMDEKNESDTNCDMDEENESDTDSDVDYSDEDV